MGVNKRNGQKNTLCTFDHKFSQTQKFQIFDDGNQNLEGLMKAKNQLVKKSNADIQNY